MSQISHAVVLPDRDFETWLAAVRPYLQAFERVAVVRSPAGNDLNRFRNVTAVQTPQVWMGDDALNHIRRVYPMVVRVDVIHAATPAALGTALQARINARDRFGETQNTPPHIFDRFTLDWPSEARPGRITRGFSSAQDQNPDLHEGLDVYAPPGTIIKAGAAGTVSRVVTANDALGYGAYIQVTTRIDNQTYTTTYAGLRDIAVQVNQAVRAGDTIAKSAGETVKLVVQMAGGGMGGFRLPNVVDPTNFIYWQGMRVRSTVAQLRIRSLANTNGEVLGIVTPFDALEIKEMHGRALVKLGVDGQWIKVNRAGARDAYAAAWFLEAFSTEDPPGAIPGVNVPGINLDLDHNGGTPEAAPLANLGWVRLLFNVSLNPTKAANDPSRYGNTDVDFTFNRYRPTLERYARAGRKVILVLTHQTFGEGAGYVWPQMTTSRWRDLTTKYADIVRRAAARFAGTGLVYAYQIWNEQDTAPEHARAAVPMPAADYAHLLTETIKAIRAVDGQVKIITGGHVGGPEAARAYARATLAAMPSNIRPDGIAFHPYGRGPAGHRFSVFGSINDAIEIYSQVMPGKPIWITEWGVLDRQGDNSIAAEVSQYARGFVGIIQQQFPGRVAAACWYAWADGMDNGYGLVRSNGQPKQPLYDTFLGNL